MAVAWTSTKLGHATTDVTVRDPVVLTATLPRFLLNGDKGTMSFDLDNVEGAPGDYTVNVKATGPVKVNGNPATTVKLAAKQRTSMSLALDAGGAGTANLDVDIKATNGLTLARHYALDVKAATQILARRSIRTLAKGESLTLTPTCSRIWCRAPAACRCRQPFHGAGCRDDPEGAWIAIRMDARADHQPCDGRCSMSTISRPARIWRWTPRLINASGTRSTGCWRDKARTARSGCGRPAAMTPGSTPMSPTS